MAPNRSDTKTWVAALAIPLGSVFFTAPNASTPDQNPTSEPTHVTIEAIADHHEVGAGQTFQVAVIEHIEPGWHTYWINPGDAGQATKLNWSLPAGYRIDDVQWPVAQVLRSGGLVTYGYEGAVTLLQDVRAPAALASIPAMLSVEAHWLVCQDICIPGQARAQVMVRQQATLTGQAASGSTLLFNTARERLPRASPWSSSLAVGPSNVVLTLHGLGRDLPSTSGMHFLPLTWGEIDNAAEQKMQRSGVDVLLTLTRGDLRAAPLERLAGVLVLAPGNGPMQGQGFLVDAIKSGAAARRSE
jgi:thiol:disulfide interchange protein DsbD